MEVRERDGPVGVERDALDPGGEAVAQPAEPAAAHRAVGAGRAERREGVEQRERVLGVGGDAQRVRADDRAAAGWVGLVGLVGWMGWLGPIPGQRERERLAPGEDLEHLRGGEVAGSATRSSVAEGDDGGDDKVGLTGTPLILYELV